MSAEFFTALFTAPVMLAAAGLFVFLLTAWSDRRDRGKA